MAKILVVEDDDGLQRMYQTALTKAGFDVTTANNGSEALVRVEDQTYDIIMLDMLMSGMSGLDFLKAYDIRTKMPNAKLIALTNILNPAIEKQARELGAHEYLFKVDFDAIQLTDHIKRLLDSPSPQAKS